MMDKDADYSQDWLHVLSLSLSSFTTASEVFFPPTSVSKQHDNYPPLSVSPCQLNAAFTVNLTPF